MKDVIVQTTYGKVRSTTEKGILEQMNQELMQVKKCAKSTKGGII